MVPQQKVSAIVLLDRHEVESPAEIGQHRAIRQPLREAERCDRATERAPLSPIDRLLGEPKVTAAATADLDDHDRAGRPRIDRDQIEFIATDADVPPEDRPASGDERIDDEPLRLVAPTTSGCDGHETGWRDGLNRHLSRVCRMPGGDRPKPMDEPRPG